MATLEEIRSELNSLKDEILTLEKQQLSPIVKGWRLRRMELKNAGLQESDEYRNLEKAIGVAVTIETALGEVVEILEGLSHQPNLGKDVLDRNLGDVWIWLNWAEEHCNELLNIMDYDMELDDSFVSSFDKNVVSKVREFKERVANLRGRIDEIVLLSEQPAEPPAVELHKSRLLAILKRRLSGKD